MVSAIQSMAVRWCSQSHTRWVQNTPIDSPCKSLANPWDCGPYGPQAGPGRALLQTPVCWFKAEGG